MQGGAKEILLAQVALQQDLVIQHRRVLYRRDLLPAQGRTFRSHQLLEASILHALLETRHLRLRVLTLLQVIQARQEPQVLQVGRARQTPKPRQTSPTIRVVRVRQAHPPQHPLE